MQTRFVQPSITYIAPADLPDDIRNTKVSDEGIGLRIFAQDSQLHRLRDDDRGIVLAHWEVRAIVSDDNDITNTIEMKSRTKYRDGDTPQSVANEFANDIYAHITAFIGELMAEAEGGSDDN